MTPEQLSCIKRHFNAVLCDSSKGTAYGLALLAYVDELRMFLATADKVRMDLGASVNVLREVVAAADAWVADVVRRGHLEASFRGLKAYRIARKKLGET